LGRLTQISSSLATAVPTLPQHAQASTATINGPMRLSRGYCLHVIRTTRLHRSNPPRIDGGLETG
jgi:hypothetical protein